MSLAGPCEISLPAHSKIPEVLTVAKRRIPVVNPFPDDVVATQHDVVSLESRFPWQTLPEFRRDLVELAGFTSQESCIG